MIAPGQYSSAMVAGLFGLAEARLRYWAQTGFISPSVRHKGRFFYTFQDLVALKVAKELLDQGIPVQRVRKNLDALRARLPANAQPLANLRVCSDGDELVVVDDGVAFQPKTGQLVMSFAVSSLAALLEDAERPAVALAPGWDKLPTSAYGCFLAGLTADDAGDAARAAMLYGRAVAIDGSFAAAWTNLGNRHEAAGKRGDARAAYERALELDPDQHEARFNLANLYADLGEHELALAEYRRVVAAAPDSADAHFNFALVLLRVGAAAQARTHLTRTVDLEPGADHARELLATI